MLLGCIYLHPSSIFLMLAIAEKARCRGIFGLRHLVFPLILVFVQDYRLHALPVRCGQFALHPQSGMLVQSNL